MQNQDTRFYKLINKIFEPISNSLVGPWKRRSLGILSMLLGFYLGSNLTVYFFQKSGDRILIVFLMVFIIEVLIRIRSKIKFNRRPLIILVTDNLRIGCIYAVVLEAFKLGS